MMIWLFYSLWNVEDESQQQGAVKPKQNSQQPGTENDQNAGAMGATSQSPIDTTNAQQSQDLVNNSQQHQMVNWNECEIIRVKWSQSTWNYSFPFSFPISLSPPCSNNAKIGPVNSRCKRLPANRWYRHIGRAPIQCTNPTKVAQIRSNNNSNRTIAVAFQRMRPKRTAKMR